MYVLVSMYYELQPEKSAWFHIFRDLILGIWFWTDKITESEYDIDDHRIQSPDVTIKTGPKTENCLRNFARSASFRPKRTGRLLRLLVQRQRLRTHHTKACLGAVRGNAWIPSTLRKSSDQRVLLKAKRHSSDLLWWSPCHAQSYAGPNLQGK